MGIQGLQSFVEIQCSSEAWNDVDFKELNQSINHGKTSSAPSVLVVDAMSCLKHFYSTSTDWVCGGQWNELLRNVENFVKAFRNINIELVVFFDGEQDTAKIQSWIQEEEENRQIIHQILSHVHNTSTFPPKRHFFAPKSLSTCLRLAFRCRNVVVCSTVGDLHKEIINYCKKYSCLGILGYHSDYLLLDAMSYYSSSHLKVVRKTGTTSVKFNTDVIFRELELDRSRLALFSTLLGNSFLPEEWLAQFHWSLLGPDHPLAKLQAQVGKQFILPPYDVVVRSVAKFVRDLVDVSDMQAIMVHVFRSPETTEADFLHRLERSIQHYSKDASDEVKENGEAESPCNYPTVSNIPKTDVLSPSNGTSESNYQKRWQHWQQHQHTSGELLKTSNKISNGISPSSSEPDVEKLVADVQNLQLKELDLQGCDEQDLLSPTHTLSAPDTPSTPTQEAFLLTSPGSPKETSKTFDAATSPIIFPPADEATTLTGQQPADDQTSPDSTVDESVEVMSPTASTDSEPMPSIPPCQPSLLGQMSISPSSSDEKSSEKPLSAFYAFISPEVLKTAKKRHQSGQMMEMVYQVLSKGEIKIGAALEDDNAKGRVSAALLYRSIRQRVYGILLDKKLYDTAGAELPRTPPPSIREWCIYGGKKLEKPDMVEPVSLKWDVPGCKQLWLGTQQSDNTNRLKAFLSCMLSDSPSMTKTTMVPQRCIILCCVLRYLIQKQTGHPILRAQELEAFLAQSLSPHLTTDCNVTNLSQIKVSKVDVRGVNLATIFMRGVETAIFANDACGSPIPWDLVCPWNYFDGKLFQSKLNITTSDNATLLDLCDGNTSRVDKLERMKWCIMEGLGQDHMLNGLPSNRNVSAISLLPSPFFGPIPAHLRNAPPLSAQYGNSQNHQNKSRGRGSKRPVSGLGGTLQVAGVPVAKFQGNRAGRGYNPNQQVVVGGRSSVDIGEHKSSLRGRGSRHSSQGRGVSWAPDTVDKDFDRSAGYRPPTTNQSTNLSQVNDFMDSPANYSPKQQRRKRRGPKPGEQPLTGLNHPGEMNPPPLMPPQVPLQDPNQMFAKMPAHFGTMGTPHGRGMMMEPPPGNMGSPNLNQRKTHMMNTPPMMAGGVNPAVPKYNMMPGLGLTNTSLHDKAMMGRGWWWEQMKQHHP